MSAAPPSPLDPDLVGQVLARHLGRPVEDPHAPLASLGLDSFTALAVRRDLVARTGRALPLVALLGERTPADLQAELAAAPVIGATAGPTPPAVPAAVTEAPLTPVQAAYWTGRGDDFDLGGVATWWFHSYRRTPADRTVELESDLDRIDRAWRRVVAHHPLLRAVVGRDGRQRVVVHDVRELQPERIDLRNAADPEAELGRVRTERSHQRRPAETWPLWEVVHVLLPGEQVVTCVGFDVLLIDFTSWLTIQRQWGELVADPARELPEPPARFLDLVAARVADPAYARTREADRDWWAGRELPPGPALPTVAPVSGAARFVRRQQVLSAARWAGLRAQCAERGISTTAAILAAFVTALARHGRQQVPFAMNLTLADRPEQLDGSELIVGDFTATALVPMAPDLRRPFAEVARQTNRELWQALDHRTWTGVEEARRRTPEAAGSEYPVVFTSGIGGGDAAADRWWGSRESGVSQTPQVLLDHLVWTEARGSEEVLVISLDHVAAAFPEGWIDTLLAAETNLLGLLAAGERWDAPGALWDPLEEHQHLPVPELGLLHDRWRAALPEHADRLAVCCGPERVTHAELASRAERLAGRLRAEGVRTGDLVLIAYPKSVQQIVAVLAVELAGAGYVPVDPGWPAVRIEAVRRRTGLTVALAEPGFTASEGVCVIDALGPIADVAADAETRPGAENLAYVIFTSGSTGEPKGVAIEHRQARTTIDDIERRFAISERDVVLGVSALSFDLSVHDVFGTLGVGGQLVLPEPERARDPQHWLDLISAHRVSIWNSAPPLLEMLVEYAEFVPEAAAALSSLRLVMLSGDWIPVTLPDRLRALNPNAEVHSLGGATEASIWSITFPIDEVDPSWPSIPYGRPLARQSFQILDEEGFPVPMGEPGDLWIGGDGVARGYIGDEQKTAERFVVHPVLGERLYRTGDLGRWRPDGSIEFLGRSDRQVKIRGHRIELGEVEAGLERLAQVRGAVVSAMTGPDGRPRLVAHVALRGGAVNGVEQELAEALAEQVPDYMVPARFVVLEQLPVTANGKIDHAALVNPFERSGAVHSVESPDEESPESLSVQETTPQPSLVGPLALLAELVPILPWPETTLVAAGVTSLGVVRLANAIEDSGRPRPGFAELATEQTVAELAAKLTGEPAPVPSAKPAAPEVVPGAGVDPVPVGGRAIGGGLVEQLRELTDRLERLDAELAGVRGLLGTVTTAGIPAVEKIPAEPVDGGFPLSEMQLAYLVGRVPGDHGVVAPHYYTEALVADLDPAALQRAFELVVGRHPMLRAVITDDTRQRVLAPDDPSLATMVQVLDHRRLDTAAQLAARDRIRAERSHLVREPRTAPMLGLVVTRLDERWWRVHFDLDLLFCDAASALLVVDELATALTDPEALPAVPGTRFADHVLTQQRADRSAGQAYWRQKVGELPPAPELPTQHSAGRVVRRRLELDAACRETLVHRAGSAGVTLTCLVIDAVAQSLRRQGNSAMTLLLTVADRSAGHEAVVGDYTGTVLVPAYPGADRLHRLQNDLAGALEHGMGSAGVHGNEVRRMLRAAGRPAAFPVVISSSLGEGGGDASQLLERLGTTEYAISQTPGVLVDVQVFEADGGLRINWDVVADALPGGWLDEHVDAFAKALLTGPVAPVRTPADRRELEARLNSVFAAELGRTELDPRASFFELGASSLQLVTIHRRLRESGIELDVVDLFAYPSLITLAEHLAGPAAAAQPELGLPAADPLSAARNRGTRRRRTAVGARHRD